MGARETISERLFQQLRGAILAGDLEAGSQHSIYALADRFGVSRTPVRDAALRLADAGMVTIERNRGLRVRGIGAADIRSIFEMRLLLEVPAARRAAAHAGGELADLLSADLGRMAAAVEHGDHEAYAAGDMALHDRIVDALHNDRIAAEVRSLREYTLAMDASTFDRSRALADVYAEHVPIVKAIIDEDADEAARSMAAHLIDTALLLSKQAADRTGETLPEDWPDRQTLGLPR